MKTCGDTLCASVGWTFRFLRDPTAFLTSKKTKHNARVTLADAPFIEAEILFR
jgi:hypothetical protein